MYRIAAQERLQSQQGAVQISEREEQPVSGSGGTKKRKAATPLDDGVKLNTDVGSVGD